MKLSQNAIQKLRATAWKKYKVNKQKGNDLRNKFIEQQAALQGDKGNHDNADHIRAIRRKEYKQDAHREVRNVLTPSGACAILHVEIPSKKTLSVMKRITDQDEMEKIMKKDFKSKFTEVYDTPIPRQPFIDIIGQDGLTKEAEEILLGDYVFPRVVHPDIIKFFQHVKMTDDILKGDFVQTDTTPEEYVSFWKQGREKISSSMSGMHNGHYIAVPTSSILCLVISELASLPWEHEVSLEQWRQSLNVAIKKNVESDYSRNYVQFTSWRPILILARK